MFPQYTDWPDKNDRKHCSQDKDPSGKDCRLFCDEQIQKKNDKCQRNLEDRLDQLQPFIPVKHIFIGITDQADQKIND